MGKVRVLLLEDNSGDAYLVKQQLKDISNIDFEIDEAQYLAKAVKLLQANQYDALLIDLMLPDSQGIETFFAINQQSSDTAIVVISGITEEELAIQAVKEGAQDYLAKGEMQPNTLYKSIQYAIERKSIAKLLKQQTQELAYANQELQAFNYTVSHDLKNPLNFIKGMSSLLLSKKRAQPLEAQDQMILERIHESSLRMEQITQHLLNLSLAQRSQISWEKANLSEIVTKIAHTFAEQQPHRQVEFKITPDIMATVDRQLIGLALENLIGNAWKYTQKLDKAIIEFDMVHKDNAIAYCVRDNGIGFNVTEAADLFAPFKRLGNSQGFEGTGIGLATVKRIIERHRGDIWFESQPEEGASFQFTLNV